MSSGMRGAHLCVFFGTPSTASDLGKGEARGSHLERRLVKSLGYGWFSFPYDDGFVYILVSSRYMSIFVAVSLYTPSHPKRLSQAQQKIYTSRVHSSRQLKPIGGSIFFFQI